jgi:hypothetical protein
METLDVRANFLANTPIHKPDTSERSRRGPERESQIQMHFEGGG